MRMAPWYLYQYFWEISDNRFTRANPSPAAPEFSEHPTGPENLTPASNVYQYKAMFR